MEAIWDKLIEHGIVVAFMGVVIFYLWREYKAEKAEVVRLNQLLLDTLKDVTKEQREDQRDTIQAMNDVTSSLNTLNKLYENGKIG